MGLDDRLGALRAAVDERSALDAGGALASVHDRARRRRQRRRLVGASIAAAVVLVVGGIAVAATRGEDAQRVTTAPPEDQAAPPPVERSQAHLWLSAETVPPGGGDLAVVIVDPTSAGDTWGVAAEAERWDGSTWQPVDAARLCLDFWGCLGQIGGVDGVEAIGLTASPVGPLTWIDTGDLEPGWYRLTQTSNEGTVAAGQFQVRPDADALPPAEWEEGAHLVVEPTVLFASEALRSAEPEPVLPPPETSVPTDRSDERDIVIRASADLGGAPRAWQDGRLRLERWGGSAWVDASALQTGGISPGIEPTDPIQLTLDAPPPGAYRVVVDVDGTVLDGRFWVADDQGSRGGATSSTTVVPAQPEPTGGADAEEAWGAPVGDRTPVAGRDADGRSVQGFVNWDVVAGRTAGDASIDPIYAEPGPSSDEGTVVGYWGIGVGWIDKDRYESSDLDDAALLAELVEEERLQEQEQGGG